MARVHIVKRNKITGRWVMPSIPRKQSGGWDWNSLPEGRYYVEWYEKGARKREPAGTTVAQALEVQRRRRHVVDGGTRSRGGGSGRGGGFRTALRPLIDRHLDQIDAYEENAVELKREMVAGKERVVWNPMLSIPAREFEFTDPEVARIKAAIQTWDSYGVAADRRWLEPILRALYGTTGISASPSDADIA